MPKKIWAAFAVCFAITASSVIVACGSDDGNAKPPSDSQISKKIEETYLLNQPIPGWTKSQLRQSLIGIETAQVEAVATTTFFFNQGIVDPIDTCSSLGLPIPSTNQLSNPSRLYIKDRNNHSDIVEVIPNMEPNGVYTGDSTGTYVLCSSPDGSTYANYWEGFVKSITGPATWDYDKHKIVMTGQSTVDFDKLLKTGN